LETLRFLETASGFAKSMLLDLLKCVVTFFDVLVYQPFAHWVLVLMDVMIVDTTLIIRTPRFDDSGGRGGKDGSLKDSGRKPHRDDENKMSCFVVSLVLGASDLDQRVVSVEE
jgi:hypothetical protein